MMKKNINSDDVDGNRINFSVKPSVVFKNTTSLGESNFAKIKEGSVFTLPP